MRGLNELKHLAKLWRPKCKMSNIDLASAAACCKLAPCSAQGSLLLSASLAMLGGRGLPHGCPRTSQTNMEKRKTWEPTENAELYGMRSDASRRKTLPNPAELEAARILMAQRVRARARPKAEGAPNLDRRWSRT